MPTLSKPANRAYVAASRSRDRMAGMVRVNVSAPSDDRDEVLAFAKALRDKHRAVASSMGGIVTLQVSVPIAGRTAMLAFAKELRKKNRAAVADCRDGHD